MKKLALAFILGLLFAHPAWSAAGLTTIDVKDAGGTTRTFTVLSTTGAVTGGLSSTQVICDPTTPTQCAAVDSSGRFNIGTVSTVTAVTTVSASRSVGNAGGVTDFAGQNATSPASAWLHGCQFNTTPTTISNGNASPCQLDNAGNLLVNVKAATGAAQAAAPGSLTGSLILGITSGATGGLTAAPKYCDSHVKYDASDNGSLKIITNVSGRTVYICGFIMATGGTATNLKLVDGTGTNCASSTPVDLTPAYQLVANDKVGALSSQWTGLAATGVSRDVCINASAGNAHQAEIWYTIQ